VLESRELAGTTRTPSCFQPSWGGGGISCCSEAMVGCWSVVLLWNVQWGEVVLVVVFSEVLARLGLDLK
jgi:hypothetical protein